MMTQKLSNIKHLLRSMFNLLTLCVACGVDDDDAVHRMNVCNYICTEHYHVVEDALRFNFILFSRTCGSGGILFIELYIY